MHIAIFGCGQLARMLALAGWPMGMSFSFVAEEDEDTRCVDGLGDVLRVHDSMSPQDIFAALGRPDVITIEKESVDTTLLRQLSAYCKVAPNPDTLWTVQHRARQKQFLSEHNSPTAPYREVGDAQQLLLAADSLGFPIVLKACENGYDGQQQWRFHSTADVQAFISSPNAIAEAIAEKMVDFSIEVSVLAVRNSKGDIAVYAPSENTHRNGTLAVSVAPTPKLNAKQIAELHSIVDTIMHALDYAGVLAIECFVVDEQILVNELAPRVHNSGHWTQDGASCSQFENHLRAITGQTLGSTAHLGHCAMINLLGCSAPDELISQPHAHLHWYNKTLRKGRKMGHVNLLHESSYALQEDLSLALRILPV